MGILSRIGWYARRLSVMSPVEILYRVREQGELFRLRLSYLAGIHEPDRSRLNPEDYLFCRATERMIPEPAWLQDEGGDISEGLLLSGECEALGYSFRWENRSGVWQQAPDTGSQWPEKFFASIDYREGNAYGDIRIAWEPSRLQHLVSLALVASRGSGRGRAAAVEAIEAHLQSWVNDNPYLCGIHYISSMECALRILSVCHALDMTREWLQNGENTWRNALYIISGHALLINRRMSLHSSTGNHTIAECAGLVYAGILFPEFSHASAWEETGLGVLSEQADIQILPDGGGIERAMWYHLFVTDLCGLVLALCEARSRNAEAFEHGVKRARLFLTTMASCANELPGFGDSDNGYALSRYMNITFTKDTRLDGVEVFDESGISVIRQNNGRDIVFLDHGPLGMAPGYGHGHADGLSVVFKCSNRILLLDPGTYTYTGDAGWREYFRSTRAHNTVCVDGEDQATQVASFMWADAFAAELKYHRSDEDGVLLLACHDGYYRKKGIMHWRGIIHARGCGWVIWDYLDGSGSHELELNWHAREVTGGDKEYFNLSDTVGMKIEHGETSIISADDNGFQGWISGTYGIKYPGKIICSTYSGVLPHEFITWISVSGRILDEATISQALKEFKLVIDEAKKD